MAPSSTSAELTGLKLPELRDLAAQRGLKGTSRMRKPELVAVLSGGTAPQGEFAPEQTSEPAASDESADAESSSAESADSEPAYTEPAGDPADASETAADGDSAESADQQGALADSATTDSDQAEFSQDGTDAPSPEQQSSPEQPDSQLDLQAAIADELDRTQRSNEDRRERENDTGEAADSDAEAGDQPAREKRTGRDNNRERGNRDGGRSRSKQGQDDESGQSRREKSPQRDLQIEMPERAEGGRGRGRRDRSNRRRGRGQNQNQNAQDQNQRDDQPVAGEELVPIAGILDIQPNHAFVRTSGYLPGDSDIYVTLGNVRRWGLRAGDAVVGAVRPQREGGNRQQKHNALVRVDSINGMTIEQAEQRREFGKLTPEYPSEQLRLETSPKAFTPRLIDLVSPVGKGQRGLIVSPPKAGKTMVIQQIAKAIEINNPEVHLMVVLVDERPEEVTDMRATTNGEVIASTFDRPAHDHTVVAELAIERAKRLVEMGRDVVVLLDSLTRLSRAYNLAAPASGRILSGGVDAGALYPPKKFFGAARNLREGGSLTIIASALVETGSKMDEVIFEEFKGTGNMELRLSRQLADRRIFPAIDVNASGTRREELLFKPEELRIMWKLRRMLGNLDQQSALELVLGKLKETQSNAEFLMLVQQTTPSQ